MKRTFVGLYGDAGEGDVARLHRAVGERDADSFEIGSGPLTLLCAGGGPPGTAGPITCAFDGTLFDLDEPAEELRLPSDTPAEVVVAAAFARWGEAMLTRLRGEFLLFLWHRERNTGMLVRDQLGARSLFYHQSGSLLTVGSEVKDVLSALPKQPGPSQASLVNYLAGKALSVGSTLFEGVSQLPGGHFLSLEDGRWQARPYWAPVYEAPVPRSRPELAEEARAKIEQAVDRRLSPSEDAAFIMSGGLDSTALAAVAQRRSPKRLKAYSGVFPEHPMVDESLWIRVAAEEMGLDTICTAPLDRGLIADTLDQIDRWKLPPAGFGFWSPPLYEQAVAGGADVMVTGDGGDELFEVRPYMIADHVRSGRMISALRTARSMPGMGDFPAWRPTLALLTEYGIRGALPGALEDRLSRLLRREEAAKDWLTPKSRSVLSAATSETAWKDCDGTLSWRSVNARLMEVVPGLGLLDDLRREAERAGLEARLPFFDVDLVTFAMGVPPECLVDRYLGKPLLRSAMRGILPEPVRMRPSKTNFDELMIGAVSGAERALISELVGDAKAEIGAYVDRRRVSELAARGPAGDATTMRLQARDLWRLASVESWLRSLENPTFAGDLLESGAVPRAGHSWVGPAADLPLP